MSTNDVQQRISELARSPDACSRLLVAALESGDIEIAVALYEPTATLFKKSGETMSGLDVIRQNYTGVIALKSTFTVEFNKVTYSGDGSLATNRMKANMTWTKDDGQTTQAHMHTLEVMRKQPDGSWRYLIDDPYGSMRSELRERADVS